MNSKTTLKHRLHSALLMIAVATLTLPGLTIAQDVYATETGKVEFRSNVPLHSFTGTSELLNGRIAFADSTVDFFVDMTTVDTGVGKRDRDMRKTLNTDEFPFAEFFGKLTTPFDAKSDNEQPARVEGEFRIHGISQPLIADGTIAVDGNDIRVKASFEISMDAFDIRPPKILLLKVADIQEVSIDVVMRRVVL